jgi:hypothetical protein
MVGHGDGKREGEMKVNFYSTGSQPSVSTFSSLLFSVSRAGTLMG